MNRKLLDQKMSDMSLDAFISFSDQTRLWFTQLQSSAGTLLIEKDESHLFVDGRYIEEAKHIVKKTQVHLHKILPNGNNSTQTFMWSKKYRKIGIEQDYLTLAQSRQVQVMFPDAILIPLNGAELRVIKSDFEIAKIKQAGDIALLALQKLKDEIKPGVSEKYLETKLEYLMRMGGAQKGSFDSIVVTGPRGALPHGRPSDKTLIEGEFLTIDFGAYFEGYASDITRTLHIGKVTDRKLLEIEEVVQRAQKMGVEAIKPGISTFEIDKICRDYIQSRGYGAYFVHGTGHGLGIDVHEFPYLNSSKDKSRILKPGMVVTVEPGVYIPGLGGVRIEDDILVTATGYKSLSTLD